jgi:hypothetical protein
MYQEEIETSVYLRNHYSHLGGFEEEFPSEVELSEEEFVHLKEGHEPASVMIR